MRRRRARLQLEASARAGGAHSTRADPLLDTAVRELKCVVAPDAESLGTFKTLATKGEVIARSSAL